MKLSCGHDVKGNVALAQLNLASPLIEMQNFSFLVQLAGAKLKKTNVSRAGKMLRRLMVRPCPLPRGRG